MKALLFGLTAVLALPAVATSMMPPHVRSLNDLSLILKDAKVAKALEEKGEAISSLTYEKLSTGQIGWVIRTAHCTLDTRVVTKLVTPIPRHPFGGIRETTVHVGTCR